MKRTIQTAPAKVNLALDILGRRPDGYHEMRMVMQTVSLWDTVTLEEGGEGFTLSVRGMDLPRERPWSSGRRRPFHRHRTARAALRAALEKRTPAYAGLGAAAPTWRPSAAAAGGYARICPGRPWRPWRADRQRHALLRPGGHGPGGGEGEVLTDLPPLPECRFVLCKPDFGCPRGPCSPGSAWTGAFPAGRGGDGLRPETGGPEGRPAAWATCSSRFWSRRSGGKSRESRRRCSAMGPWPPPCRAPARRCSACFPRRRKPTGRWRSSGPAIPRSLRRSR